MKKSSLIGSGLSWGWFDILFKNSKETCLILKCNSLRLSFKGSLAGIPLGFPRALLAHSSALRGQLERALPDVPSISSSLLGFPPFKIYLNPKEIWKRKMHCFVLATLSLTAPSQAKGRREGSVSRLAQRESVRSLFLAHPTPAAGQIPVSEAPFECSDVQCWHGRGHSPHDSPVLLKCVTHH